MSQLHLDVVQHRLKRRFDLEIITHEPKIPYRETITTHGRGPAPAQEAVRRPRPVRRGPPARLSAAARHRHQGAVLRRSSPTRRSSRRSAWITATTTPTHNFGFIDTHRRRHHSQPVHPGRREGLQGAARTRRPGRLSHPGRGRRGLLRQGPPGGQLGSGVQDGRPHRLQERLPGGPAGAAGADRRPGGDGAVEVHRRHPGRPEHQAGPHREPGQPAGRPGGDHGARRRWPR